MWYVFFFKQQTAYEMRISDWSSDVCSSDLALIERMPDMRIGTVDKFQGKEAPIVIYSMTSSTTEDAPRGMTFLFSPNRLNVATSRAKSVCIQIGGAACRERVCQ